jgi:hypothetical protein
VPQSTRNIGLLVVRATGRTEGTQTMTEREELDAANQRAANFEVMLVRLCYRLDHGKPIDELVEKAKDLIRRIGKSTPLRAGGELTQSSPRKGSGTGEAPKGTTPADRGGGR